MPGTPARCQADRGTRLHGKAHRYGGSSASIPMVMIARLPTSGPEHAVTALSTELLTLTARPAPSGAVVVAASGDVDCGTSPLLQDALLAQVRPAGPALVIDLSDVGFFGAAGLTVLVTVRQAAVRAGVRMCVVACGYPVLLPLTLTELDRVFDIYPVLADLPPFPGGGSNG